MRPINECWRGVAGRALRAIAPVLLVLAPAAPVAAQESGRMWAAQTGANQVTLAWDSVPGAYEYRIFAGSPEALTGNLRARPSVAWLSGSGRSAIVSGIQRLTSDLTLVATDRSGRVLQKKRFNRITRATAFAPVQPPDEVTAEASTATEVTLTWTPVPGATAYFIGRAAGPSGLRVVCTLCSTEARYVDDDVVPGIVHSYVVSAIFPSGMSPRAFSNQVTPGATQLATTAGTGKPIAQPVDGQNEGGSGSTPGGGVPQPGTATTAGGAVHTATPVTPTTATPTTGTPTTSVGQGVATAASGQVHAATPVTTTSTTTPLTQAAPPTDPASIVPTWWTAIGNTVGSVTDAAGNFGDQAVHVFSGITAPAVSASGYGPGTVRVSWTEATSGITQYKVSRRVNGGPTEELNTVGGTSLTYTDAFFPATLLAAGPVQVRYYVTPYQSSNEGPYGYSNDVTVTSPAPAPATPTTATPVTPCKLDYQRADNMWAAFGRPDGPLGLESISLAPGGDKVFVTDWKYEKSRNDGTNYYGSHLRVAANQTSHTVRMQLRTTTLTGLDVWLRTGSDTFWIKLAPGKSQQFQADLMEVFCEQ